ncbi:hypothetical protein [Hominifimenecus sp. rT4P-3]|uniref:hypothetical protein n=1 Tax=Hominifimenecus sp. rT4P-3 TaxID=3242979 RepID=UPI003DA35A64
MKKENICVKKYLSFPERERFITIVADSYFESGEDGAITYAPYRALEALAVGFFTLCVEGITYEEGEDVYQCLEDPDLRALFEENRFSWILTEVDDCARDLADFHKDRLLTVSSPVQQKLAEALEAELLIRKQEEDLLKKQEEFLEDQKKQNAYAEKVLELMTPEEIAELNRKMLSGQEEMEEAIRSIAYKVTEEGKEDAAETV